VLRVGDHLRGGDVVPATLHHAIAVSFAAALGAGLLVAAGAAIETRGRISTTTAARIRRGVAAVALVTLLAIVVGGLAAAGNPVKRIEHGWNSFKGGYGTHSGGTSRLVSGLGSNRYDFYRVALDEFAAHPVLGIGADNYQARYLAHGRSQETPHYPHSVELRTLTQTGVVGGLVALVGLAAALAAGMRATRASTPRRADPLRADVAAAALAGFAYWAVHGSIDWFWEFAGLGAPAFAMLGIACALSPRAAAPDSPLMAVRRELPSHRAVGLTVTGALVALAATWSLAAPWLSQREVERAAGVWTTAPGAAYARLDEAARLNPLSDEANLVAGSVALRYGDLARADHQFALALGRVPGDAYATLERGAIASALGRRGEARRLLEAAVRLNPRDNLTREALDIVRAGKRINIVELNRSILIKARQLA
jgi:tetratricopeptide (TPR) repeat protein